MIHTLKYKEYILKQFLNHNIRDRTEVLYEQANNTAEARPRDFEKNLNQVDKQITEILLKAEKKFAVDPLQRWINNATIRHMYKVIKYWQTMISAIKHKKDFNTSLNNLKKQLPAEYLEQLKQYDSTPTLGLSNIRKELRKQKDLQLQEMRDQEATESAMIAQAEYKSSMHIEQRRSQVRYTKTIYASLRNRFRPPHTLGLTSVIVPTNNGEGVNKEEVITNPYEVENHIINRNIEHFGQAQGTPFTSDKITKMLGYTGVSQQANNIIQGANIEELIQNMGPGEQKILRQLNNGKNTPTISITITQKEFMTGFRKWRESTSTSPSGRHLGHYKALLRAELIDNQPVKNKHKQKKPITNNPKGVEIFKPIYQTAIAALQAGVSLIRWKQVQSSMIEKDPGKPYLHRLRVIHLYEADYNLLLKILWSRKLTWKAHIDGSLHESQAGSRPGRRAIDLVVFKEQKYLYSRLTRTTVLTMDNDAKACYDRIICNLAMLISQYFGMPENACNMQAKTIKDMEFKLKTALGVSTQQYKHSPTTPVHGSGQGSCASPTLWLLISSILMRCLENGAPGMELYPIEKTGNVIRSTIDGFVDDTSLFTNLPFNQHSLETAVNNVQSTTQLWAQLLEASGGKLELQKCFYYVLKWNFTSDGEPIPMSIAEQAAANITPITIKDSFQNKNIPIQQKECNSHHKTLGVYKNMLGDETYQCEILAQKSYNLAQIVNSSHMSKQQARLAYTMIYIPTITYSLAACSYTLQQAGKIQAKALDNFLPVMGWRRTSARALVHGPLELGGINVPHLYAIQGATKLMTLFNHIRGKTALGLLLITNINWVQLISGKGSHILSATDYILYIHNNWILNPQEYMHTCYLTIKTNIFWLPSLQRVNDELLMEAAGKLQFTSKEMRTINNWRMFFQVISLSDICDGYGNKILDSYIQYGKIHTWHQTRESTLKWPLQGCPGKESFKIWRKFITQAFRMQENGIIGKKLEAWVVPTEKQHTIWSTYYSRSRKKIYKATGNGYVTHTCIRAARLKNYFSKEVSTQEIRLPDDAVPATCQETTAEVEIYKYHLEEETTRIQIDRVPREIPHNTYEDFIATKPTWEQDLCSHWQSQAREELEPVLRGTQGSIWMAVESTIHKNSGYYTIVLGCSGNILFQNRGRIEQNSDDIDMSRMHWIGMLSAIINLKLLLQYFNKHNVHDHHCHISSSNCKVVTQINKFQHEPFTIGMYGFSHMDVVLQILEELQILKQHQVHVEIDLIEKAKSKERNDRNQKSQAILQNIAKELLKKIR